MKKLILSILAFSLATTALPQQVKEIEILPNEKWWGSIQLFSYSVFF